MARSVSDDTLHALKALRQRLTLRGICDELGLEHSYAPTIRRALMLEGVSISAENKIRAAMGKPPIAALSFCPQCKKRFARTARPKRTKRSDTTIPVRKDVKQMLEIVRREQNASWTELLEGLLR